MEDYRIDIMIDSGPNARSIQINLNPFTLVGATTYGLADCTNEGAFRYHFFIGLLRCKNFGKNSFQEFRNPWCHMDNEGAHEIARQQRHSRIANALFKKN